MSQSVLILGIGNLLWADEGFGVRCIEHLTETCRFSSQVTLLDGGTQGIYLLQYVQAADLLVVFDAVDYGLEPGTLKLVRDDEVPRFMGAKKMSLHQTGFQEVLSMADFTGQYPSELLLVGVQPAVLEDFGGSLTQVVRAQIEPAVEAALAFLSERGIHPQSEVPNPDQASAQMVWGNTANQADGSDPVTPWREDASQLLRMPHYEAGRPTELDACRYGDSRVIAQTKDSRNASNPMKEGKG